MTGVKRGGCGKRSDIVTDRGNTAVRRAGPSDADAIGRLLHDFNAEFREPTPASEVTADRMRDLLPGSEPAVLLAEPGPSGLAVLRFRPGIYSSALECYLAELYVVPDERAEEFTAVEVAEAERPPVLRAYLQRWK